MFKEKPVPFGTGSSAPEFESHRFRRSEPCTWSIGTRHLGRITHRIPHRE
jgi:hypothetical protein